MAPPPFLATATLVKAIDFERMFYIGWYVINNPFHVATLVWIMWLNCDRKSSFFVLECFLILEAASLILDCCARTKLLYSQYVSYSFHCIKLNDTLVS